ncbi:MAG: hypothetical protein GY862_11595, partial [Gammaproteobacteria bacterium]|nr:hypothetical protein [Gammaproteobacteria bacterium]
RLKTASRNGIALTYGYDNAGNRTGLTLTGADFEQNVSYAYDALNRLKSVQGSQGKTLYAYIAAGSRQSVSYPNGVTTRYAYDKLNRLTSLTVRKADNSILAGYSSTLYPNGLQAQVTEHIGRTIDYTYDDLYRLSKKSVNDNGVIVDFSYQHDKAGNVVYSMEDEVHAQYAYDSNDRLLKRGDTEYSYDDNGNLLSVAYKDSIVNYAWDGAGQLVKADIAENGQAKTVAYVYDADGSRIQTQAGGQTIRYIADDNQVLSRVIAELDAADRLQTAYLYGDDLISQARSGNLYYYHYDGHGNTRALSDIQGSIADTYDYAPYGELLRHAGSTKNIYLYAGEQYDTAIRQYYLRNRWYNQANYRFSSMDGFAGVWKQPVTLNKYLYANADPVNYIDPAGQMAWLHGLGVGIQAVGILASVALPSYQAYMDLQAGKSLGDVTVRLARDAAIGIGTSLVAGGILRYAPSIIRIRPGWLKGPIAGRPRNSIWNIQGNTPRGEAVENILLGQPRILPWNYPVIDDFTGNVARSIKSLDLTASSSSPGVIKSKIRKAALALNKFVPRNWGDATLANSSVNGRLLDFAFERGAASKKQMQALNEMASEIAAKYPDVRLVYRWLE